MSRFHWHSPGKSRGVGPGRHPVRTASGIPSTPRVDPAALRLHQWVEEAVPARARRVIVEVSGDLDGQTAPQLLSALTRNMRFNSDVCCDLGGVGFFGIAGADALAVAHLRSAAARGSFSVRGVGDGPAMVLEATGLDAILTVLR